MTRARHLALMIVSLLACRSEHDGGETEAPADTTSGPEPAPPPMTCEEGRAAAAAFLSAHSSCVDAGDCTTLWAPCLDGNVCGWAPVSTDHDFFDWVPIAAALDRCDDCVSQECAECTACIDGTCALTVGCG